MKAAAFCPAHVTGFFKADRRGPGPEENGSLGAGFSIRDGVRTTVRAEPAPGNAVGITTSGYKPVDTALSEFVARDILGRCPGGYDVRVHHEIAVPVGYGLGSSGAAALSLAIALDEALGLGLGREGAGRAAHRAEVLCRTGLGDVIAAYHGGFEIRTRGGPPGVGALKSVPLDSGVTLIGFSPVSTRRFIDRGMDSINGLGGRMVDRLARTWDVRDFQEMSVEFARRINVMTPRMESVAGELRRRGVDCGVALFGETIFALTDSRREIDSLDVRGRYGDAILLRSRVDNAGARLEGGR